MAVKLRDRDLDRDACTMEPAAEQQLLYDSCLDALLALHEECSKSSGLSNDRNVARFLNKFNSTVDQVKKNRLTIDDFETRKIIGQGHFGEVCMVREKVTGHVFAMKIMRKAHVLQQADAAFFLEERDIMAQANSQWLASLHYAFQDSDKLYLVMEFYPGGDLLTVMQRYEGQLTEQHARFYLSEIIAGLSDLHQLGFVHRDVKPDNVLITKSGHIKLIDFGSATRVDKNGKVLESRLPVGTPEYISPEVLTSLEHGASYGVECDWWSIGIILYELLYDTTPFESDTTSQTYCNIMSYKTSLQFTNDTTVISDDARDLICHLLVESSNRLQYSAITAHPFFTNIDWDNLMTATPPFIPNITGPDDTSNFDTFDPIKDDSFATNSGMRSTGFSGRSLPFVGFTYTGSRSCDTSCDLAHHSKAELDVCCKECSIAHERCSSLERECVVYKTQLEDLQRKLNIERNDRHVSDSRALQLLAEIKEKAQVAENLRQTEAKATHDQQLAMVVSQLEQEKTDLSRRLQRLQVDVKKRRIESDNAISKIAELKNRMAQMKEANKKDITNLQAKLTQVTETSQSHIVELQNSLQKANMQESAEQHIAELNRDLMAEKRKTKDCDKLRSTIKSMEDQLSNLVRDKAAIEAKITTATTELQATQAKLSRVSEENIKMAAQHSKLLSMNADTERQLARAEKSVSELTCALQNQSSQHDDVIMNRLTSLEEDKTRLQHNITAQSKQYEQRLLSIEEQHHNQVMLLHDDVSRLKRELSEMTSSALRSAERLTELRKIKQTLERENHTLQEATATSSHQYTADKDSLTADNKRLKDELAKTKQNAMDYKKQYEEQELSLVLLKRNVQSLESELADANTIAQESNAATASWREARAVLESDLELAETKLDDALQSIAREKDQRMSAEGQVTELVNKIELVVASRTEEETEYKQLLNQQRQTAEQYSEQLAALQKELGVSEIKLKETQHELSIEKSLSTKIYDDYHSLGREHGKLKAAHLKVCNELKQQTAQLAVVSHEKEQAVKENVNMAESLAVERVKLQTQTAQFTKLVDYQHTPLRSSYRKRSIRRKRDPERELAEWNKLKRMSQHDDTDATPTSLPLAASTASGVMEHNIPHRFITQSIPFHKSTCCSTCNMAIKVTQKLAKCTYCGLTCHYKCVSTTPNTCGLPGELADHLPRPAKRQRTDNIDQQHKMACPQLDDSLSITFSMLASDDNESDIII